MIFMSSDNLIRGRLLCGIVYVGSNFAFISFWTGPFVLYPKNSAASIKVMSRSFGCSSSGIVNGIILIFFLIAYLLTAYQPEWLRLGL